jgi:hypothetical protein
MAAPGGARIPANGLIHNSAPRVFEAFDYLEAQTLHNDSLFTLEMTFFDMRPPRSVTSAALMFHRPRFASRSFHLSRQSPQN